MSNEIKIRLSATLDNGSLHDSVTGLGQVNVDQANPGRGGHLQTIGTSEEDIDLGDISVAGYCFLRNTDAMNFVTYGPKSGGSMVDFGKLKPGEPAFLRLAPSLIIRAQADTAAVKLDVKVWED